MKSDIALRISRQIKIDSKTEIIRKSSRRKWETRNRSMNRKKYDNTADLNPMY